MPILCYADKLLTEVEPAVAFPNGLHVVVDHTVEPDFELAQAIVPLYVRMLTERSEAESGHLYEYLGYVARRFEAESHLNKTTLSSPLSLLSLPEGLVENEWPYDFASRFDVQAFANTRFLPGRLSPARAVDVWEQVAAGPLTARQIAMLGAFVGKT
jgi:hypothetical protein